MIIFLLRTVLRIAQIRLTITDSALKDIIRLYTREAGVRSLERTIGKLCRKAAREIFKDSEAAVKVTKTNLKTYLVHARPLTIPTSA